MPEPGEVISVLDDTERYLTDKLLPFWIERSPDAEFGGFLTYFDRDGRATGETTKTFLMQIRMLYTMASAHRAGYGGGRCARNWRRWAPNSSHEHYWDAENGGWFWIADRIGPAHGDEQDRVRSVLRHVRVQRVRAGDRARVGSRDGRVYLCGDLLRTWLTRDMAGIMRSCAGIGSPNGPACMAATARAWTCTCT